MQLEEALWIWFGNIRSQSLSISPIPFEELVLYSTVFLSFFHDKGNCMSIFVIRHLIYPAHFAGNKCRRINESPLYISSHILYGLENEHAIQNELFVTVTQMMWPLEVWER